MPIWLDLVAKRGPSGLQGCRFGWERAQAKEARLRRSVAASHAEQFAANRQVWVPSATATSNSNAPFSPAFPIGTPQSARQAGAPLVATQPGTGSARWTVLSDTTTLRIARRPILTR
jgi:hypothetical protein